MEARHAAALQADPSVTSQLLPGKQFCVWFDQTWLSFWVPVAEQFYRT
jgi:hypothetical protein